MLRRGVRADRAEQIAPHVLIGLTQTNLVHPGDSRVSGVLVAPIPWAVTRCERYDDDRCEWVLDAVANALPSRAIVVP